MPEWLWIILVGGVVLGLLKLIYSIKNKRDETIDRWKEKMPMPEEILTKSSHADICKENTKPIKDLILENREIVKDQLNGFREYFDLKIENTILTELRKINNK